MSFETRRPPSSDEKFEKLVAIKRNRKANMTQLKESSYSNHDDDYLKHISTTLESIDADTELDCKREADLNRMMTKQNLKSKCHTKLSLYNKLYNEGISKLTNDVIYKIVYNSLWIDDDVKSSMNDNLKSEYCTIMDNITKEFCDSKCNNDTMYLQNVKEAIEQVTEKACKRIVEDADVNDDYNVSFETNEDEEKELDNKLSDLGTDQIVQLVKDKVLTVVQDEQKAGVDKKELMKQIEDTKKEDAEMGKDKIPVNKPVDESWLYLSEAIDFEQDRDKFEVIFRRGCEAVSTKHFDDARPDLKRALTLIDRIEKSVYAKDISDMNQANRCMQFYNSCQSIAPSNFRRNMPSYTTSDFLKRENSVYSDVFKSARSLVNELIKYCDNEGEYSNKEKDRRDIDETPEELTEGIRELGQTFKHKLRAAKDAISDKINMRAIKITRASIIDDVNEASYGELAKMRAEVEDELTKYNAIINDKARIHKNKQIIENYKNHVKWLKTLVIPKIESRMKKLEKYDDPVAINKRQKSSIGVTADIPLANGISAKVKLKESMDIFTLAKTRKLNQTTGSSLFEALMINSLKTLECAKVFECDDYEDDDYDDELDDDFDDYEDEDDEYNVLEESISEDLSELKGRIKRMPAHNDIKCMEYLKVSMQDIMTAWDAMLDKASTEKEALKLVTIATREIGAIERGAYAKAYQSIPNEIKRYEKYVHDFKKRAEKKAVQLKNNPIQKKPKDNNKEKNVIKAMVSKLKELISTYRQLEDNSAIVNLSIEMKTKKVVIIDEINNAQTIKYLLKLRKQTEKGIDTVNKCHDRMNRQLQVEDSANKIKTLESGLKLYTDWVNFANREVLPLINKRIKELEKNKAAVKESYSIGIFNNPSVSDLNTAALYEALFAYTIMETLNTIKLYDFKTQDIKQYSRKLTFSK